jgi:hypothetical protein
VGVFFPRFTGDRASDTPVATLHSSSNASPSFLGVAFFLVFAARPRFYGLERIGGCEERLDHRVRRLVKVDASFWSGMPSIVRDPS